MDFHEQVGHDVRRASARMSFIAPETDLAVVADWEAVQTTSTPSTKKRSRTTIVCLTPKNKRNQCKI